MSDSVPPRNPPMQLILTSSSSVSLSISLGFEWLFSSTENNRNPGRSGGACLCNGAVNADVMLVANASCYIFVVYNVGTLLDSCCFSNREKRKKRKF